MHDFSEVVFVNANELACSGSCKVKRLCENRNVISRAWASVASLVGRTYGDFVQTVVETRRWSSFTAASYPDKLVFLSQCMASSCVLLWTMLLSVHHQEC
jgi:hypothetical protein